MPPDPTWTPPAMGLADLKLRFGAIAVEGGQVTTPGWESRNMVMVPDFPGVGHRLYVNKAIVAPLRAALLRCLTLGDGYGVKTIGCFAPRAKRVNGDLSVHSWGLAVDINADQNPLAPPGVALADCVRDLPDAWVAIFEDCGWTWGGRFHRPDPMHMQWVRGY